MGIFALLKLWNSCQVEIDHLLSFTIFLPTFLLDMGLLEQLLAFSFYTYKWILTLYDVIPFIGI